MRALLLFVLAFSGLLLAEDSPLTFQTKGLKSVRLSTPSGNITLTHTAAEETTLTVTKIQWSENCSLQHSQTASNISASVEVSKSGTGDENTCQADLAIALPKVTQITATVGRGSIGIEGVKGSMTLKIGEGNIAVSQTEIPQLIADLGHGNLNIEGNVLRSNIHVGQGDVKVVGALASGDVKIGNGTLDVNYTYRPAPGTLDIKTGRGNATLTMPRSTSLNANIFSGLGHIHSEIPNQITGNFRVNLRSGMGNLYIKAQ